MKERLVGLQQSVIAASTRRAYLGDWKHFAAWSERHRRQALPAAAEDVALHLADHADRYAVATLTRRLVAISQVHASAGHESPTRDKAVRDALRGIRRRLGQARPAHPAARLRHDAPFGTVGESCMLPCEGAPGCEEGEPVPSADLLSRGSRG